MAACEKGRARRGTDWIDKKSLNFDALFEKTVDMRCRNFPAMQTDVTPTEVIGEKDDHIGPVFTRRACIEGNDQRDNNASEDAAASPNMV